MVRSPYCDHFGERVGKVEVVSICRVIQRPAGDSGIFCVVIRMILELRDAFNHDWRLNL